MAISATGAQSAASACNVPISSLGNNIISLIISYLKNYHLEFLQPKGAFSSQTPFHIQYATYVLERHVFRLYTVDDAAVQTEFLKRLNSAVKTLSVSSSGFFASLVRTELQSSKRGQDPEQTIQLLKTTYGHIATLVTQHLPHFVGKAQGIDVVNFAFTRQRLPLFEARFAIPLTEITPLVIAIHNFGTPKMQVAASHFFESAVLHPSKEGAKAYFELDMESALRCLEEALGQKIEALITFAFAEMATFYPVLNDLSQGATLLKACMERCFHTVFGFPLTYAFFDLIRAIGNEEDKLAKQAPHVALRPTLVLLPENVAPPQPNLSLEQYLKTYAPLLLNAFETLLKEESEKCALFLQTFAPVHRFTFNQTPRYGLVVPASYTLPLSFFYPEFLLGTLEAGLKTAQLVAELVHNVSLEEAIRLVQTQLALESAAAIKSSKLTQEIATPFGAICEGFIRFLVPSLVTGLKETNTPSVFPPLFKKIVFDNFMNLLTQIAILIFEKRNALDKEVVFKAFVELPAKAMDTATAAFKALPPPKK